MYEAFGAKTNQSDQNIKLRLFEFHIVVQDVFCWLIFQIDLEIDLFIPQFCVFFL